MKILCLEESEESSCMKITKIGFLTPHAHFECFNRLWRYPEKCKKAKIATFLK
jgi:hypothetical protein